MLARADRYQRERRWLGLPIAVVKKFGEDRAGQLAALVAYYVSSRCSRRCWRW